MTQQIEHSLKNNRNFSSLNECKICNSNFKNLNGLSIHLRFMHKLDVKNYISEYVIGHWPLCKCGCNNKVGWYQYKFHDYLSGHMSKTSKNAWFRNVGKQPVNKIRLLENDEEKILYEFITNHKQLHIIGHMFKCSNRPISRFLIKKLGKDKYSEISRTNNSWRHINNEETNKKLRIAASLGGNAFSKKYNTQIEKTIKSLLKEIGIRDKFVFQFRLKDYDTNSVFCFDFGDKYKKVLIECDGDYWHANPTVYDKLNETQIYNTSRDKLKNNVAEKNGYKLFRFWESDINNDLEGIKKQLQLIKTNIYGMEK